MHKRKCYGRNNQSCSYKSPYAHRVGDRYLISYRELGNGNDRHPYPYDKQQQPMVNKHKE